MRNPRLTALLSTYGDFHRHPVNRLIHFFGIPLIVLHVVAMLDWIVLTRVAGHPVTVAMLALVAVGAWYLSLDAKLGALMTLWYALCIPLGRHVPPAWIVAFAVVGWGAQFIGHAVWEKRSPALLANLVQALVGPMYFADKLLRALSPPRA
jgi:uncharacterized membrane protein YGL010W